MGLMVFFLHKIYFISSLKKNIKNFHRESIKRFNDYVDDEREREENISLFQKHIISLESSLLKKKISITYNCKTFII